MAQHTMPENSDACHAMASSVETPQHGISRPHAKPLAAATPMRTPVKLPGPAVQATASMSFAVSSVISSRRCADSSSVRLCVRPQFR